jgi:low temperature requirement protein LtrA
MRADQRNVSWMELFFDLILVASAHQITHIIAKAPTFVAALPSILLFIPILWAWVSHTLFTNQFEDRSWFYHTATFFQLIGLVALTVFMPHALTTHTIYFALAYVAIKVVLLIQYSLWSLIQIHRFLHMVPVIVGNAGSGLIWFLSIFADNPIPWWFLAMAIDILTPIFTKTRDLASNMDAKHLPERFGLLTVIVLGEMIISLVISAFGQELTNEILLIIGTGVGVATLIFWSYFRYHEQVIVGFEKSKSRIFFMSHLPLVLGIIAISAGYQASMVSGAGDWMLVFGIILFTLSFRLLRYVQDQRFMKRQIFLALSLLVILGWYYFFGSTMLVNVAVLTGALILYLLISEFIFGWEAVSSRESGRGPSKMDWNF